MSPTKIMIATPTYNGTVTTEYFLSIRSLESALQSRNISVEISFTNGSDVTKARNAFISLTLNDPTITHILFIDADMAFRPEAVLKLLNFGKPYSGCICPLKSIDIDNFHKISRLNENSIMARNISQTYVTSKKLRLEKNEFGNYKYAINNGFVQTREIGCGITLIHRSVIEDIKNKCPDLILKSGADASYKTMGVYCDVLLFFQSVRQSNGSYLSEDLSFAWRWVEQCGGEIWACVDEVIGHIGVYKFEGRAIDRLIQEQPTNIL